MRYSSCDQVTVLVSRSTSQLPSLGEALRLVQRRLDALHLDGMADCADETASLQHALGEEVDRTCVRGLDADLVVGATGQRHDRRAPRTRRERVDHLEATVVGGLDVDDGAVRCLGFEVRGGVGDR